MPIPFLSAIGLGLKRAGQAVTGAVSRTFEGVVKRTRQAVPAIQGAVSRGLSDTAVGRLLERVGIHIPKPVIALVKRKAATQRDKGKRLKFLGRNVRPNPRNLPKSITRITRKYAFFVVAKGGNVRTGEEVIKHITISTEALLTRGEIEDRARAYVESDSSSYPIAGVSYQISDGIQNEYEEA